jgi:hypothetical protein
MRKRSVAVRSALLTVRDLVGGLIAAVGLGALIAAGGKSFPRAAQVIAVLVAGAVLVKSVRIWANGGVHRGWGAWVRASAFAGQ